MQQRKKQKQYEDDEILRDGESIRIPMTLMDSLQRELLAATLTLDQQLQDPVNQARAMSVASSVFAHKGGPKENDQFNWGAMRLMIVKDAAGELCCRAQSVLTADAASDARDAARLAANAMSENAWKRRPT